jgi:hypothetical protein
MQHEDAIEGEIHRIEVENGEPVGGIATIKAKQDDTVSFVVTSDVPDEVHVHGYELAKPVAPGKPARFSFTAELEGIFEVEIHEAGDAQIAKLVVEP